MDLVVYRSLLVSKLSSWRGGVVGQDNSSGHWEDFQCMIGTSSAITDFIWL